MASPSLTAKWIWHPDWNEAVTDSAGGLVYFRKSFSICERISDSLKISISADTKFRLYVNCQLVHFGPVKGDQHMWFYDEVDLKPHLRLGQNMIVVQILRLYYATGFAVSFPRLPYPGFYIQLVDQNLAPLYPVETDVTWESALDPTTRFPVDNKEDDFLHTYEEVDNRKLVHLKWLAANLLDFPRSHGLTPPWKLVPRMIPFQTSTTVHLSALHNIKSCIPVKQWQNMLLNGVGSSASVILPRGTKHHIEVEVSEHVTAFLSFRFARPQTSGSRMAITYSECYEDEPMQTPYLRCKSDRCDTRKSLLGPSDSYTFGGIATAATATDLRLNQLSHEEECFIPFHFRTFRFLTLDIEVVEDSDLAMKRIEVSKTNYPLDVRASFDVPLSEESQFCQNLWFASLRTLTNCLHDCYEDCPFYEQLQYVMDTRSSILFTYNVANDDRLARQAIMQLHNSYQPSLGLTASRAPAHQTQIIPHFSLYWVCTVCDHFQYFGDAAFVRQFLVACDGVLETFARWISPETGLIRHEQDSGQWNFVDWTDSWRPYGIPPAAERTSYSSYTSMLYAYVLKQAAILFQHIGRAGLAQEYESRASSVVSALKHHCFDGEYFTDGLANKAVQTEDYSQNSQIWAVLCGAATGTTAMKILQDSHATLFPLDSVKPNPSVSFAPASLAMSFYTLRAFSTVQGNLYDQAFHQFWSPWRSQLAKNLTTWEEDSVSQRSDCHAWGCAPLFEFTAEVAGIKPGAPGCSTLIFSPRVRLFREFSARVPYGGRARSGTAHVSWKRIKDGGGGDGSGNLIEVRLRLEMDQSLGDLALKNLPMVKVMLGDTEMETVKNQTDIIRLFSDPGV